MNIKFTDPNPATPGSDWGSERTEAMLDAQKQLLGAYEEASRAWLARMQSEVDLWTGLAAKLTATRSVPEAVPAYQECVSQRIKMAAEDSQRLAEECQKGMNRISQVMSNR
jgi:hypothetical protein